MRSCSDAMDQDRDEQNCPGGELQGMTGSETAEKPTLKSRGSGPSKRLALPKRERGPEGEVKKKPSKIGPWVGVMVVVLILGVLILEDVHYRQERDAMLKLVQDWALPGQSVSGGKASLNAAKSMEYRQALMTGQGFLRSSRLQPENREASLAMARFHFRVALKQLGEDSQNERARLKLLSRIAEIEKSMGAEFGVLESGDREGMPLDEGETHIMTPEVAP